MAKMSLLQLIHDQWKAVAPVLRTDLTGKTVIVIGANVGIGFEASKHFARMNPARVILACRSKNKGEEALAKLQEETGYKNAEVWIIDLGSFASVSAFAEKWNHEGGRLDILVANAGIVPAAAEDLTADGWDRALQVNDLSTFLLSLLLLPKMLETANTYTTLPRLVVVASGTHYWSKLDGSLIDKENPLRYMNSNPPPTLADRYYDTKALNVLLVRALNDRLSKAPLVVCSVDPGYCYSQLRRNYTGVGAFIDYLMERALAITAEEGSRSIVWSAIGGEEKVEEIRGAYVARSNVTEPSDFVISAKGLVLQSKLWENLVDELGRVEPKVRDIVEAHLRKGY